MAQSACEGRRDDAIFGKMKGRGLRGFPLELRDQTDAPLLWPAMEGFVRRFLQCASAATTASEAARLIGSG